MSSIYAAHFDDLAPLYLSNAARHLGHHKFQHGNVDAKLLMPISSVHSAFSGATARGCIRREQQSTRHANHDYEIRADERDDDSR